MNSGPTNKGLTLLLGLFFLAGLVYLVAHDRMPPSRSSPDEANLEEWVLRMQSPNASIRYEARRVLIRQGGKAVPALVELLESGQPDTRYEVLAALCQIQDESRAKAVPALIRILRERDPELQRGAIEALRSMGPLARAAAPVLRQLFWEPAGPIRGKAANASYIPLALASIERGEAVPFLIEALNVSQTRHETVFALGKIGPSAQAALAPLRALASDPNTTPFLKHCIAQAVARIEGGKGPPLGPEVPGGRVN